MTVKVFFVWAPYHIETKGMVKVFKEKLSRKINIQYVEPHLLHIYRRKQKYLQNQMRIQISNSNW